MTALALVRDADFIDVAGLRAHLNAASRPEPYPAGSGESSLKVLTCGSVDDGKSTLIGRLLWDTDGLPVDQRARIERSPRTPAGTHDFSLLVDGLVAEREQGITIDVAWRYLDAGSRRLVIIDSPGHTQYTRNMATGASHADVAILLVDARSGIKEQTRRHAALLDLMGVRRVVLAVNKMDLAAWSEARFTAIRMEFEQIAARFGFLDALAVPVSAVLGDNVASRSESAPWYNGPSLLQHLDVIPSRALDDAREFRFPVQLVVRSGQDFRGLAGTLASGSIGIGDEVTEPISGRRARVNRIVTMDRDLERAHHGQAIVLELDTDLDISRGAVLACTDQSPAVTRSIDVRMVWLSDEPLATQRGYLLRTATDLVPITGVRLNALLDLATLAERPASVCAANDIAIARLDLGRSAAVDLFAEHPTTGSFILVDPVSGASVAGGVITATGSGAFRLTRAVLANGVGADLPPNGRDADEELRRRANEVAILLRAAGVTVDLEDGWARTGIDPAAIMSWLMAIGSFGFVGAVLLGFV